MSHPLRVKESGRIISTGLPDSQGSFCARVSMWRPRLSAIVQRRFPVGAEPASSGVHFRVWAPIRKKVDVVMEGACPIALENEKNGFFSGWVEAARAGLRYRF